LLEGLEVKVLNFKDLELDNEKFRIDDEFYLKKYIDAYKTIKSKPNIQLKDISKILTDFSANGSYATIAENFKLLDEKDYAYMVRTTDLEKSDFVNDVKYVNKHTYNFLNKSKVYGGEILINKIGSPGRVYLMPKLNKPVSLGMNLFLVRLIENADFNEKFVWVFFNTKIGQNIIKRKVNGTVPLTIDKEAIRTLYLPKLSKNYQGKIAELVDNSESLLKKSKNNYLLAENLLLETLNLKDFQLSKEPVNVKNFSQSYGSSGRLDAEYYQVKYEQVVNRIISTDYDQLVNIVKIKKSIEPGSSVYADEGLPFVRVSDYNKFGLSTPDKYLTDDFCKENAEQIKKLKPKKETILFSKDGSVGTAYMLREDADFITSGAILHLTVKDKNKIIPEYLTLALNSKLVQMQAERDAGGSIILHWRVSEIEKVVVPIIDFDKQRAIADLVEESFQLKKQSEHLLEVAKTAVEMAIEKDEKTAMEYINNQIS